MHSPAQRSRSRHPVLLMCALAALLTAGLASCGYSASISASTKVTPSRAQPTETSDYWTVTPYLATPASTVGWQIYTDSAYHFKTVIPPGWRIGTALDPNSLSGGDCEYEVIYFPPGDTHSVEPHVTVGMHEFMQITVYLECPQEFNPAKDEYVSPRGSVTISGVATTLYGEDNNQDVDRFAVAEFGGHSYSFVLTGQSEQHTAITADVPLYLGVLSGFVYQGSK